MRNYLWLLMTLFLLTGCLGTETAVSTPPPAAEPTAPPAARDTPTSAAATEETAVSPTTETADQAEPTEQPVTESTGNADADVVNVRAVQTAPETWTFHVTVAHPDTGWEDYADGWDVVLPDGTVILPGADDPFTRLLLHPHENEQPFTRSQSNILIPADVTTVTVRAHDLVDGFGGQEVIVDLSTSSGNNYTVEK